MSSLPDVIGSGLGHDITRVGVGFAVVFVNGWMPVQGLVFLDVTGIFANVRGQEFGMELELLVARTYAPWVNARLWTVKCVCGGVGK